MILTRSEGQPSELSGAAMNHANRELCRERSSTVQLTYGRV